MSSHTSSALPSVALDSPARPHLARPAAAAHAGTRSRGWLYCTANPAGRPGRGSGPASTAGHRSRRPSGPASSTDSSPGQLLLIQQAPRRRPFDASPAGPPASHACRHRRTDRSVTRSSAAISAAGTRCPNLSTAASRTCSRRLRPSAVNPPPCAYRIPPAYPRKPRPSAPRTSRI